MVHMEKIHKAKQLHKCHVCSGVEFESEILLNSHIASIHNKISCDICDWKGSLNEDLTKHLEISHNQIKCDKCNYKFKR